VKLSLRVWPARLIEDRQFDDFRALLDQHRGEIDELALIYVYAMGAYMSLDEVEASCAWLAKRIATLRSDGFGVGVNDICLGHLDDPEPVRWGGRRMVGHDGVVADGSLCPRAPETLDYLSDRYRLVAGADPQFIWVDDDMRMQHHRPAEYPCFCASCVDGFSRLCGVEFGPVDLARRLGDGVERDLRGRWADYNSAALAEVCQVIGDAVREVDPSIEMGLMTGTVRQHSYASADMARWMRALGATKGRPGAGFYTDRTPAGLVSKCVDVAAQTALYPPEVSDVQYELETFPQQRGLKSVRMLGTESAAVVANGMRGVTAHILKPERGSIAEYGDWLDALCLGKGLWSAMEEIAGEWPNRGAYPAQSPRYWADRSAGPAFELPSVVSPLVLAELGVPLAHSTPAACVAVLAGETVDGHTESELLDMLRGGVVMDGAALELLTERGLARYCGVSVAERFAGSVVERFTEHEFNAGYLGEERDGRLPFYAAEPARRLVPAPGCDIEVFAQLVSYADQELGAAGVTHENLLGGRVAVFGYSPWRFLYSRAKRSQVLAVLDWAARGRLPVLIPDRPAVIPFLRSPDDQSGVLLLLVNGSLDATGEFDVRVRGVFGSLLELDHAGRRSRMPTSRVSRHDGETVVRVDDIGPWDFAVYAGIR
jgi:hypothetical protein